MNNGIPASLHRVFPSYDVSKLDVRGDKEGIIAQVLNHGTWGDVKWLYSVYSEKDIKQVVLHPHRGVWFPKVLTFWETVLDIKIPKQRREKALFRIGPE